MSTIHSAIACNVDTNILLASLPLFDAEKIQAIEWAFDAVFRHDALPDWFDALLRTYADANRLVGHGVFFSLFSGRWTPDQQAWLTQLKTLAATYRFDHITEHFGFMTGADFHKGAPLSIPLTQSTLAIGQDRLRRIQDAGGCPVGLENLAFAYSLDEVKRQGDFLHRLLEPVNGFIILDLHNLYCQSHNFGLAGDELLALYPLEQVREMHISGGSWSASDSEPGRQIRRDTHDEAVPDAVFDWLEGAIDRCPNLRYVVLEQLGSGLTTEADQEQFRNDFLRMDRIVEGKNQVRAASQPNLFRNISGVLPSSMPLEDDDLHWQQRELATILETAADYRQARALLATSGLAHSAWEIERWEPAMLETAMAIAQKWQHGFD
ncbi:MAG: DUF692 family protein [Bacteroidetes bacterium]|nr:DUF692 family protein [Fibrella sp.]